MLPSLEYTFLRCIQIMHVFFISFVFIRPFFMLLMYESLGFFFQLAFHLATVNSSNRFSGFESLSEFSSILNRNCQNLTHLNWNHQNLIHLKLSPVNLKHLNCWRLLHVSHKNLINYHLLRNYVNLIVSLTKSINCWWYCDRAGFQIFLNNSSTLFNSTA